MSNYVITSPHSQSVDLGDDDEKIQSYLDSISDLSKSDLYSEMSNLMSAIHNLKFKSITMHPFQKFEIDAVARDLNTKVILIGIFIFGGRIANVAEKFLALVYRLDEQVNQMGLDSAKHGEKLIALISDNVENI